MISGSGRSTTFDYSSGVYFSQLRELICLGSPDAAHLQPDGLLRPILQQRPNQLENDGGRGQHGDHNPGATHHLARHLGRLATPALEIAKTLRLAVPPDHRDVAIEKPMSHGRTHQTQAQQPHAGDLKAGLAGLCWVG